jgi:aspartate/tyrosine/aromatic aminotransferase
MESIFDGVEKGPPIEVFALNKAFLEDSSADKVNLGVGGKILTQLIITSLKQFF